MIRRRRVVVTGVGMVTPLGIGHAETLAALGRGDCAIAPVSRFDASGFRQTLGAEVVGLDPRPYFSTPKAIKLTDQAARLGVVAARLAMDESRYPREAAALESLGVIVGSSGSDWQSMDLALALAPDPDARAAEDIPFFADRIRAGLNPLWLLVSLPNMISSHVAIQLGARGPNSTVMTDCVSGLQAVGEASDWIGCGEADAVLAGGADTGILPFAYGVFEHAGLFDGGETDGTRCGFVPGEGAAIFMLEERQSAIDRGASILGEIVAYASAAAPPRPDADRRGGAFAWTLARALDAAGWTPGAVAGVSATAVGAPALTRQVHEAVETVFGNHAGVLRGDHTPWIGNALSAAGAIEAGLLLTEPPAGRQMLCGALGYSGQAVTLALRSGLDDEGVL